MSYLVGWPAAGHCEHHPRALAEVWEQSWGPPHRQRDEEQQRMEGGAQVEVEGVAEVVAHHPFA